MTSDIVITLRIGQSAGKESKFVMLEYLILLQRPHGYWLIMITKQYELA